MKTYLVGGAVRDKLLGVTPKERDWVVVGSSPQEMKDKGFKQVERIFQYLLTLKLVRNMHLLELRENLGMAIQVSSLILINMLVLRRI